MLSSSRNRLTNRRIRCSPQARLVRGTSRAIVNADQFNVRTSTVKAVDIDSPIRLGKTFWTFYTFVGLPILFVLRPWSWDDALISRIAAALLLPFAAALIVYCLALLIAAISFGGIIQRRKGRSLFITLGIVAIVGCFEWALFGFKNSRWTSQLFCVSAAITLYRFLSSQSSDQSSDRALSSGTPAAGQPARHP